MSTENIEGVREKSLRELRQLVDRLEHRITCLEEGFSIRARKDYVVGFVSLGTLKEFCETIGIEDDDDLKKLQCEITEFDDDLWLCWDELQEFRKKDKEIDHPLLLIKDELERIEVAHRDMSRIVREHEKR